MFLDSLVGVGASLLGGAGGSGSSAPAPGTSAGGGAGGQVFNGGSIFGAVTNRGTAEGGGGGSAATGGSSGAGSAPTANPLFSGQNWLWIGLGAVVLGVIAYFIARKGK